MTEKAAIWVALGSLVVSVVSAVVSNSIAWSAKNIARSAKKQAQKAAELSPRGEVIGHLYAAVLALNRGAPLSIEVVKSVQNAKLIADRVFSVGIRDELNGRLKAAQQLASDPHSMSPAWSHLIVELEGLIARMNEEANLGR